MPDTSKHTEPSNEDAPDYLSHIGENFSSIYFGAMPKELQQKKDSKKIVSHIIALLTDGRNRNMKDDVLLILKNSDSADILVDILKSKEYREHRRTIAAACWESGIDFSKHLDAFIRIALEDSYETCLEAMTVIEQMQGPFEAEQIHAAIGQLNAGKISEDKQLIVSDIELRLRSFLA
ncbi:MAG: hypothetical protein FD123_1846 [Bacteroidetes bacterium]|nr:MAG: hypothetical protein FD123_1846 [Bacteroidota bacterium]